MIEFLKIFDELVNHALKKETKLSVVTTLLVAIVFILSLITIIDISTNDDSLSSSSTSVLYKENVQFEIRKNENKFREDIYSKLKKVYLDKKFQIIDSISKNGNENSDIKNYVIINKLKSSEGFFKFYIRINQNSTPLVSLKGIKVKFEIDFTKLNKILEANKSKGLTEENIKYGNYLKTFYEFDKKVRIDYLIIISLIILALSTLLYFATRISSRNKKYKLEEATENLTTDKKNLRKAQKILNNDNISEKEILRLKEIVLEIENNLDSYKFDNILDSILYEDVVKAERKSLELYNRSTLMLILGLLVAIAGIFVFYFTLPEFNDIKRYGEYLALTIRPTLILIFIQSISFYLLKQYRSLISDYKYFHEEYLKKSKVFIIYQLMQNDSITDIEMKLIDSLLIQESNNSKKIEEEKSLDENKLLDILKSIIEKAK